MYSVYLHLIVTEKTKKKRLDGDQQKCFLIKQIISYGGESLECIFAEETESR